MSGYENQTPQYQQPQAQAPEPYGAPSQLSPQSEIKVGALAHGITLAAVILSGGLLGFISALVIYLLYSDRGPFVRAHAANALNVQIAITIGLAISGLLMLVLIGFLTYPIIWVFGIVLHVIGVKRALDGQWWNPPMIPRFVK